MARFLYLGMTDMPSYFKLPAIDETFVWLPKNTNLIPNYTCVIGTIFKENDYFFPP